MSSTLAHDRTWEQAHIAGYTVIRAGAQCPRAMIREGT
jgi:hypothetical protein